MRSLGFFVLLVALVAGFGALFPPDAWYRGLPKPSWNPPDWVFPLVWGVLYLGIAVAGWRLWRAPSSPQRTVSLWLWGLQLLLNALWTPLFFGLHRPLWALCDLLALFAVLAATPGWFRHVSRPALWIFVVYTLWMLFALALTAAICVGGSFI